MPELPEVETVVRGLAPHLVGAVAGAATITWAKVLDGTPLETFNRVLAHRAFDAIHRRGKYICMTWSGVFLVVHLRMTGRLYLSPNPEGDDPWVRFSLALNHGRHLIFSDARKFGRVQLAHSLDFLEEKLGPEPLTASPEVLRRVFGNSNRPVKPFLLDQKNIAGLGNIYADEALHLARIHPTHPVSGLSARQKDRLCKAIREVLRQALVHEGATIGWYRKPDGSQGESQLHFRVYGRGDQPCLRCGTVISKIVLGQRGTHFCRKCQPPKS